MSSNEEKNGIVLNRMYTGDYLSTNLGHEVINMFQADDDKHYLYLNARGNFTTRGKDVGTMLLVRGIGGNRVEVIGMAKNLHYVESACCTLPRDIGATNTEVRTKQEDLEITYDKESIFKIFGKEGQQSVYVSYWVDDKSFYVPKPGTRLIIAFKNTENNNSKDAKVKEDSIILKDHNFASTSLHQFIDTGDDLEKLQKELCGKEEFWVVSNIKLSDVNSSCIKERRISLFDICQIQNDENRFSNALSYFILQYPEKWQELLQKILKIDDLDEIESVTREEDAKVSVKKNKDDVESAPKEDAEVDNDNWEGKTGGRIDLLLRTKKYYIIIENKIDSDVIVDTEGKNQLSRYYNYVKHLITEQKEKLQEEEERVKEQIGKRCVQLNNPRNKNSKFRQDWEKEINDYKVELDNIKKQIDIVDNKCIIGRVLTPNYNKPKDELLKMDDGFLFKSITYKDIYKGLEEYAKEELEHDVNFKDFYNAMKQHTYEYKSEALYNDMLEKFIQRIKTLKSNNQ